jgi:hypothetical protein
MKRNLKNLKIFMINLNKMILFKPLHNLEKKYFVKDKNYIALGSCGKIYSAEEDVLIKISFDVNTGKLLNDKLSHKRLYNEAKVQDLAFELGVRFPKVQGFYAVKSLDSGLYYPGLCMQDLGDITLNKLSGAVLDEAERQRDLEIEKARDLGFKIKDIHNMNAIWFEEKTYLLDAGIIEFISEIK